MIIVFGHSHLEALHKAASDRKSKFKFLPLSEASPFTNPLVLIQEDGNQIPNPAQLMRLHDVGAFNDGIDLVSIIGGNAHNVLGLLRHSRPFDIVLPNAGNDEDQSYQTQPKAELIPYEMMIRHFEQRSRKYTDFLRLLKPRVKGKLWHLESPPPCPDEEFIRNNIDTYFKDRLAIGLTPATLRYRLWRCHSDMIRRTCKAIGITFIPAPPASMDENGFLRREGWGNATHGNAWYGAHALDQIEGAVKGVRQ